MAYDTTSVDPHGQSASTEERSAALRRLQSDQIMHESDLGKIERELDALRIEIRTWERKRQEIEVVIQAKKQEIITKEQQIDFTKEELRVTKKRMNTLKK